VIGCRSLADAATRVIAEQLNMTHGSVKTTLSRARRSLADLKRASGG
jgi:DNA-directed RNA polymerase specialized sigma24 family protein